MFTDDAEVSESARRELGEPPAGRAASCPNCGMEPSEWSEPSGCVKDALTYCCAGCANDTGCGCFHPATRREAPAPKSRRKGAAGRPPAGKE
ncbi:MAG: hypothetical protein HY925_04220 [Elusimicrobia bacterium]|nr:hypothetical protein [Elusimicrobiota bacterium]